MEYIDLKTALALSSAGKRFIAQMTLYNTGNFERLATFIAESYTPEQLAEQSAADRLAALQQAHTEAGRLRVFHHVSVTDYRVVLLLQSESGSLYYNRLKVDEEYPHLITQYIHRPHGDK
ncbi:MAG: hypothetical protein H6672_04280 [Anaerolineaceae bacterium]|nr:hypothetical protein [Anaerolineaceae bacterium]